MRLSLDIFRAAEIAPTPVVEVDEPGYPKAVDSFGALFAAEGIRPDDYVRLVGQQHPDESGLQVANAAALLASVTKSVVRRFTDKANEARLSSVMRNLEKHLSPEVLANAPANAIETLDHAMRDWLEQVGPKVSGEHEPPKAIAALHGFVVERCSYEPPAPTPVLIAYPDEGPLESIDVAEDVAAIQIVTESKLDDAALEEISAFALRTDVVVQVQDFVTDESLYVWSSGGRIYTDDASVVERSDGALEFGAIGDADTLTAAVEEIAVAGGTNATLFVESPQPDGPAFDVARRAIDSFPPLKQLTIADGEGRMLLSMKNGPMGLRISTPKPVTGDAASLLNAALDAPHVQELSLVGLGFKRAANGDIELSSDGNVTKHAWATGPVLAEQFHRALGERATTPRNELRPLFLAAMEHQLGHADVVENSGVSSMFWNQAIAGVKHFASAPASAALLDETLSLMAQRSEPVQNDGFGHSGFRGHATGDNAAALLTLFATEDDPERITDVLKAVRKRLSSKPIRVLGGLFGVAARAKANGGTDTYAARVELARIDDLVTAFSTVRGSDAKYSVEVIPTDRSHGEARTKTPDFLVRRTESKKPAKLLFVDAKSNDARSFDDNDGAALTIGFEQVATHQFHGGDRGRQGMVMLELYNAPPRQREALLDSATAFARREARKYDTEVWVHVTFGNAASPERYLLSPKKGYAAEETDAAHLAATFEP